VGGGDRNRSVADNERKRQRAAASQHPDGF